MTFLRVRGDWVEGREWVELLSNSVMKSTGSASLITSIYIKKTGYMHQVNLYLLLMLLENARKESLQELSFNQWITTKEHLCSKF